MLDAMLQPITLQLSHQELTFDPEQGPARFEVWVYNDSDRFASFQLELRAAGSGQELKTDWYRLAPAVSSKIPAGDRTRFEVEILTPPPIPGGFTNATTLTARVFSPELQEEERQDLQLIISGSGLLPPSLKLHDTRLRRAPNEEFGIGATLTNPNRKSLTTQLQVRGLNQSWFPSGSQKNITLQPNETREVEFRCALPKPTQVRAGTFSVEVKAAHPQTPSVSAELILTISPTGHVVFRATSTEQQIPNQAYRWLNPPAATATYQLILDNQSNASMLGNVSVRESRSQRKWFRSSDSALTFEPDDDNSDIEIPPAKNALQNSSETTSSFPSFADPNIDQPSGPKSRISEDDIEGVSSAQIPIRFGEPAEIPLTVTRKLPWLGWARLERLEARAQLVGSDLDLRNDFQVLELQVLPIISVRLQLLLAMLSLLFAATWFGFLGRRAHTGPVAAVQFNGQASEVMSASADQTLRRWKVKGRSIAPQGVLTRFDKAVRAVRYRPVNNNEVVAALENGSIQKLDLLTGQFSPFLADADDRALDAIFTRDSRQLYSGHGSGRVWQWPLELNANREQTKTQLVADTNFAIYSLALTGAQEGYLAIAGERNELQLLNLHSYHQKSKDFTLSLPYPDGGTDDYIMDLATSEQQPNKLATADNQGNLMMWDIEQCLQNQGQCAPLDQWKGHGGMAVNSVALSADGCYLTSAGDDGRAMLWPLSSRGNRRTGQTDGKVMLRVRKRLNTVDVIQQRNHIAVVSGGDDHRVRMRRVRTLAQERSNRCNGL